LSKLTTRLRDWILWRRVFWKELQSQRAVQDSLLAEIKELKRDYFQFASCEVQLKALHAQLVSTENRIVQSFTEAHQELAQGARRQAEQISLLNKQLTRLELASCDSTNRISDLRDQISRVAKALPDQIEATRRQAGRISDLRDQQTELTEKVNRQFEILKEQVNRISDLRDTIARLTVENKNVSNNFNKAGERQKELDDQLKLSVKRIDSLKTGLNRLVDINIKQEQERFKGLNRIVVGRKEGD
jgi:chromosome segregation ATPase